MRGATCLGLRNDAADALVLSGDHLYEMAGDIRELIEQLDAARALCPFDVLFYERADACEIAFGGRLCLLYTSDAADD